MSRGPTGPRRIRAHLRPNRGQEAGFVIRTEHDRDSGRWLLERLEERGLCVLVHAMRRFHDRDASAALERQQREVRDQVAHATVGGARATDDDLPAGTLRRKPMQVRVVAMLDEPAAPA